jgi:hypothetical protein
MARTPSSKHLRHAISPGVRVRGSVGLSEWTAKGRSSRDTCRVIMQMRSGSHGWRAGRIAEQRCFTLLYAGAHTGRIRVVKQTRACRDSVTKLALVSNAPGARRADLAARQRSGE